MPMPTSPMIQPRYVRSSRLASNLGPVRLQSGHKERIRQALRNLGVSNWGVSSMEARYLPSIIHANEQIGAVLYGFCEGSFSMLVATDRRIIFLDKKPLFVVEDEIDYHVISGVSYGRAGFGSTVVLHTRIKDFAIRTFNDRCAKSFVTYIESRSLEHVKRKVIL